MNLFRGRSLPRQYSSSRGSGQQDNNNQGSRRINQIRANLQSSNSGGKGDHLLQWQSESAERELEDEIIEDTPIRGRRLF